MRRHFAMLSLRSNEEARVAYRNRAPLDIFAVRASLVVGESEANSDRLLDGDQIDLLLLHFYGHMRFRRKLENGCLLAFIQAREEDNVSIREFQRIAVDSRLSFVYLPEDPCLARCFVLGRPSHERPDPPVCVPYFTSKRQFRAGQNTDSRGGISHRSKAASAGAKVLRHQFVADFRWARAHTM